MDFNLKSFLYSGINFCYKLLKTNREVIRYGKDYFLLRWIPGLMPDENLKITQVSGFVFSGKELLIVKVKDIWTIPGGKPENGETNEQVLTREVLEESGAIIQNIRYIGYVFTKNLASKETSAQLRYSANFRAFKQHSLNFESTECKFVELHELSKYIKWANGLVFRKQLSTAMLGNLKQNRR